MHRTAMSLALLALLVGRTAAAQVPQTMSYQGVLTDGSGNVVADGSYNFQFSLYNVSSGGTALWSESQSSIAVSKGVFNVVLGSVTPIGLPFDAPYWLGIAVGGGAELTPRTPLAASPYALGLRTPLPGIAQATLANDPVVGNLNAPTDALDRDLNLSFTVPANGYVVLQASGYLAISGVPTGTTQWVGYQVSETTGVGGLVVPHDPGYLQYAGFQVAPNPDYFFWPIAVQRAFVATAGTHRYSFCSGRVGDYAPTANITDLVLTATFYPTSYGAVTTAPSAPGADARPIAPVRVAGAAR